jgi:hypothetical protein
MDLQALILKLADAIAALIAAYKSQKDLSTQKDTQIATLTEELAKAQAMPPATPQEILDLQVKLDEQIKFTQELEAASASHIASVQPLIDEIQAALASPEIVASPLPDPVVTSADLVVGTVDDSAAFPVVESNSVASETPAV